MCLLYLVVLVQLLATSGASQSGIVGGNEAKPHSRPYMASLQTRGSHTCGGVLIRKDFVLTSAHCLMTRQEPLMVVLGAHNISKKEKTQQHIPIQKYYPHPKYKYPQNDIMLLKLKTKAKLNKFVKHIGLPKKNGKTPANMKCSVAGWGMVESETSASDVLMETTVKTGSNSDCEQVWEQHFNSSQMMCTLTDAGKGFCQGDSGGPLVCKSKAQGIVAFNYAPNCKDTRYPHVYMKIPFFMPWIKEMLNE
ncbi:granzyme H-like isoform X3 [Hypomesus transpacificus]|uniref:granzyme H-like isoform X3 n=1 Tax=Hypomesus transpacificus TaxID=137520 RepID=UPI001F07667F|nr:granzyme H-like isoform X3 [Hypomesus transpacificus]